MEEELPTCKGLLFPCGESFVFEFGASHGFLEAHRSVFQSPGFLPGVSSVYLNPEYPTFLRT